MSKLNQERLLFILFFLTMALPIGLILAAPVMREPDHTISATDYFGNDQ